MPSGRGKRQTPNPKDGEELFGPGRGWEAVRAAIEARLLRKLRAQEKPWWSYAASVCTAVDIEEAVASAMLDLVDYWVGLESSVTLGDPQKTFNYACWRGSNRAVEYFFQEISERGNHVAFDPLRHEVPTSDVEPFDGLADAVRSLPADERQVIELRYSGEGRQTLEGVAERLGRSRRTVARAEERALNRLRRRNLGSG